MLNSKIRKVRQQLAKAETYEQWKAMALELDFLEDKVRWKEEFTSDEYNYALIQERLQNLRQHTQRGDFVRLRRALREGLHHDLGNMGNPALYRHCNVGTKYLIEEYLSEVCDCLELLCDRPSPDFPIEDKLEFFRDTLTSYGRPALLLSGGASLGMFHFGVIKALFERNLLPRVIAGSSIGAIVAGVVGVHTDDELPELLTLQGRDMNAWKWKGITSMLRGYGLMDQDELSRVLKLHIGDYAFEEAYRRTGRSINISVSPVQHNQKARLLSGYSSPYLMIRSAALASAAVPGIFPPVTLLKKDLNGQILPYMPRLRFVDGSVVSDLPIDRLTHLYDVNYTFVSQTNPHVVPFLNIRSAEEKIGMLGLPFHLLKSEIQFHGRGLFDFLRKRVPSEVLRQVAGQAYTIMAQRYSGDVTVAPKYTLEHYLKLMANPDPHLIRNLVLEGERSTWGVISEFRSHARISNTLERCVRKLKEQKRRKTTELRLVAP